MTAPYGLFDNAPDPANRSLNHSANATTTRDRAADRRALLALGVGSFAIGTGEFVIMGLLPDAARDLAVTIPEAGHLISAYALGVVIGAPLLAVLGARWPRRNLLIALMSFFAAGNVASALAPGYLPMIVARLLTGFPHLSDRLLSTKLYIPNCLRQ